ncbi:hypothetical protein SAMN04490357_7632 [Streptomyces misionensis]|uniref:Uncharacterized protein n=1 Tax=Streptomyces misionensis TaxID=67331 RepID=A0A1H5HTP9_9ACTN|nr:hypothetical protein SAMN04490357_7632 [Streptomyces misionensis]
MASASPGRGVTPVSSMTSCRQDQMSQSCRAEAVWFKKTSKSAPAFNSARAARAEMQPSWDSADCRASRFMRSVCRAGQGQHLAVGDQAARGLEEGFVDVGSAFPADAKSFETVEPCEGALDHPPIGAQAAAMGCAAPGSDGEDPTGPDLVATDVVVVAAVGEDRLRLAARPPGPASDGRDGIKQGHELGDVVAVVAGEDDRERGAVSVVIRWCLEPAHPRSTGDGPVWSPFFNALTWPESTTALDQSSRAAAFSSASSTSCSCCQTPASFQSRSRHQHVIPDPKPSSWGRCSHWIPVCSTNRIPHSTCRSGTGLRPGYLNRRSRFGKSGSIRSHRSSDTILGQAPMAGQRRSRRPDTATGTDPSHCVRRSYRSQRSAPRWSGRVLTLPYGDRSRSTTATTVAQQG